MIRVLQVIMLLVAFFGRDRHAVIVYVVGHKLTSLARLAA